MVPPSVVLNHCWRRFRIPLQPPNRDLLIVPSKFIETANAECPETSEAAAFFEREIIKFANVVKIAGVKAE